jgi:hypothetical protein
MSTTPHPIAPEEIMAHLDGELSLARAQSVSSHLDSCVECQAVVTSLRNTSHSLSSWSVAPAPVNTKFVEHLCADAAKVPSNLRRLIFEIFPSQRWKLLAASGVLVVLLITIAGFMGGRYDMSVRSSKLAAARRVAVDIARVNNKDGSREALESQLDSWSPPAAASANGSLGKLQAEEKAMKEVRDSYQTWIHNGPLIAHTVSLSLIAKDFDSSRASLDAILARHNGYSANLSVSTPQGAARSLQAALRIPAPQLSAALTELKSLGRVELENQNGEEVTQQHADLVARLKNSRETEQRLQAILTQRTGKISDVLEVEQEIARVRGEIEQMEAEQKNIEHRVDFATIDLKLSEEYKAKLDSPAPAISTLIHNAAVNGYRNVADTLLSIILFFAEYGPVLAFWLLLFSIPAWLVWRRWRHATAAI